MRGSFVQRHIGQFNPSGIKASHRRGYPAKRMLHNSKIMATATITVVPQKVEGPPADDHEKIPIVSIDPETERWPWENLYEVRELPREGAQDPKRWESSWPSSMHLDQRTSLQDKELADYICLCGDIVQIGYMGYDNIAEQRPGQLQRGPVGGASYWPSDLTRVDALQLNVAEDSPARKYRLGVPLDGKNGKVEDDTTFYLFGTSGMYRGEVLGQTVSLENSRWMGYVSIGPASSDGSKQHIMIDFRGTVAPTEWVSDAVSGMVPWAQNSSALVGATSHDTMSWYQQIQANWLGRYSADDPVVPIEEISGPHDFPKILKHVYVSQGFEQLYRRFVYSPGNTLSLQGQVHVAVRKLLAAYGDKVTGITVTGHSLGGALAQLCAFDLVASGINHQGDVKRGLLVPVTCVTFNSPRVGNWAFADFFKVSTGPRHLRIHNSADIVPRVPFIGWGQLGDINGWAWFFTVVPTYVREILGQQAGQEKPRVAQGDKVPCFDYHHGGHPAVVDTDWQGSNKTTAWLRKLTHQPYLADPFREKDVLASIRSDLGDRHDFQKLLWRVSPSTRGMIGPLFLKNKDQCPCTADCSCP